MVALDFVCDRLDSRGARRRAVAME
jgi:hypothetical protein